MHRFELFRKLRELFGGISIIEILAILKAIAGVGTPPPIDDEAGLRKWITELAMVLGDIADKTKTTVDDAVVAFCLRLVNNDDAWTIGYTILKLVYTGITVEDEQLNRLSFAIAADGDEPEIDPVTIMAIIKMIVDIIKLFKKEKPNA